MKFKRIVGILLRLATASVWLLTSVYALLAYVPFTYRQVLSINLIPAVQSFASVQPVLLGASALIMTLYVLFIEKGKSISLEDRREYLLFLFLTLAFAFWNAPRHLTNDSSSLWISLACLIPPVWLSFFNLRELLDHRARSMNPLTVVLCAAGAGLLVAISSGLSYQTLTLQSALTILAASLAGGFAAALIEQLIRSTRLTLPNTLLLYSGVATCLIGSFILSELVAAVAFFGVFAFMWSFAFAASLSVTLISTSGVLTSTSPHIELPSLKWLVRGISNPWAAGLYLAGLATLIPFVHEHVGAFDWNGLAQKTTAFFALIFSFLFFTLLVPTPTSLKGFRSNHRLRLFISAAMILPALALLAYLRISFKDIQATKKNEPAFLLARNVIFPLSTDSSFFSYLQSRTNLPRTQIVKLPNLTLVPVSGEAHPRPHIFVFVIDSLRRDYVSTYNAAVKFTPQMKSFGESSVVFKNAFTRFGATGLSEPSIWAGRMFPHQMYPQPFETINLLHQLVQTEKYETWISRDSILSELLKPAANEKDLDVGVGTQDLDICQTSDEILSRLRASAPTQPIFTYTQSQNIHVSVLARAAASNFDAGAGFNKSYANALSRVDTCFGKFIDGLKALNLYDDSIIILTSDHGDSLGEEGRYGHAYTIYPEVMRIPLIVHVPPKLLSNLSAREDLVFSTDLSPTLAFLLNYKVDSSNWWEGRPLFFRKGEKLPEPPKAPHLVMSSYGPVAGLISAEGDSIYIADAINFTNSVYQINERGSSNVGFNEVSRTEGDATLKEKFDQLYSAFGL